MHGFLSYDMWSSMLKAVERSSYRLYTKVPTTNKDHSMRQVVVYGVSVQTKILVLVYNSFVVYTMALTNKKWAWFGTAFVIFADLSERILRSLQSASIRYESGFLQVILWGVNTVPNFANLKI